MSTDGVREYYDLVGEEYDALRNKRGYLKRVGQRELGFVLRRVPERSSVLEIGPGTGFFTRRLVEKAKDVVAIDISQVMLDVLKERVPADNLTLFRLGIEDLPSLDRYGHFDCVVCMRVLPHVVDPRGALSSIHGALLKGGKAVLDFWGDRSFIRLARGIAGSTQSVFTQYYPYHTMVEMIESAGFEVKASWGWGYPGLGLGLADAIGYRIAKRYAHAVLFNIVKT